eukprot:TRINITY_DN1654_c0_g1_i1.p1 TRINITY_DN1654_c0_g1~~TRINITY_DN1654_c0_g1_i1.p1  ORF type:complete len:998 (+),score=244.39 TRINITY_DN1654_c0_g1_i1:24-3017(+)
MNVDDLFGVFETKTPKRPREDDNTAPTECKRPRTQEVVLPEWTPMEDGHIQTFGSDADRKICTHELCLPPGYTGEVLPVTLDDVKVPARTYPFVLDPFQKISTACLERNHSVLVAAHTSAGKTVVAEYAIALALKAGQRVIYTSPIKALSNQKYRELQEEFQDVGLMTGDITINPSASCLVMTTEILRSMLYRGSEVLREIGWVIFDEIHYMRDKERGVVWEETIILLPDTIKFVFLSATIPNAREFASWIAKIHNQPCHVVYTDYRPVPLQHYIFPAEGTGLHLVVDEKGVFREENFQAALASLVPKEEQRGGKNKQNKGGSDCYKIVKMIMERNYQPVIVFSFSKKSCELLARQMAKLDFNNDAEKELVDRVFNNAMETLSEEDRALPQIQQLLPLLKRGIGIHHSGLLPLLKEVIEILFQEGLIKCLFATETFSIGLNMPAKTVVFTSVRKFDGKDFRWVSGGEYIQMSGRSGRRGLDDRGIVILMVDEKMEPQVAQNMVKGRSDSLISSFHIGYNMLLNLLRVEGIDPTHMLRQSFHQYQNDKELPKLKGQLAHVERQKAQIKIPNEAVLADYFNTRKQAASLKEDLRRLLNQPVHCITFLNPGRLIYIREGDKDWGWGICVNYHKRRAGDDGKSLGVSIKNTIQYNVDMLLRCQPSQTDSPTIPTPWNKESGVEPEMQIISVLLDLVDGISTLRIYLPTNLDAKEKKQSVHLSLKEVEKRFPDGIPTLDPIEDMKIEDPTLVGLVRKLEVLDNKLKTTPQFKKINMDDFVLYQEKMKYEAQERELKRRIRVSDNVILKDNLKFMKRVLRRLGFLTVNNVVDVKGRVACEIQASDELVLTEMLFSGFFTDLKPHQIPAIMSCFVFEENTKTNVTIRADLQGPFRQFQDIARRVAEVSKECKLEVDVDEYVAKFRPDLIEVVYRWCEGASFADICGMTPVFEGSIIRGMRRLEELLRQLVAAAKTIGDSELESNIAEGITLMKRDIVFAASLYL